MISVSDVRTSPVGEDLTTDASFSIVRGLETMYRVDKKKAAGISLVQGEWAVLNSAGEAAAPSATPVAQTYLVFLGSDRFDSHATGAVTLVMNSAIILKTSLFEAASYNVGQLLTVKASKKLVGAGAGEWAFGKVVELASGVMTVEVFAQPMKA